ncbi:MAG: GAF domain-containing protein [Candidatus Latescibacteria bacterium]|nr:GAF domain-containing protein [Candidatus Latescibacterota bacterium]
MSPPRDTARPDDPSAGRSQPSAFRLLPSLSSLSFAVQSAFDPQRLVAAVAEHVLELARADRFALLLLDYETGELDGDHFARGVRGPVAHARVAPRPGGFLAHVLRRETLIVEDPLRFEDLEWRELHWEGPLPQAMVGVPIIVGTSLLGIALLGFDRPLKASARRRRALLFLADQIGLAVDRIRTRAELEQKASRLEEAQATLRRVDEMKSELISVVSHELRTPLTSIKAYTETLLENQENPSFTLQEKFLGIINEECDRLSRIVNDVLDLSRMDSGKRRLNAEPLSLSRILDEVVPTVEPQLIARRLSFARDLAPALPAIEADPDLLKQVLVNLINNAAKFSPEETRITLRAARAGERMQIVVEDQGVGIPPDKLGRVFERFYRVEDGGTRRAGGTGLGLAIVKGVVELHGGTIRVESEMGKGSRFVVELPLVQHGFRNLMLSLEPFFETPVLQTLLSSSVEMVAEVMEAKTVSIMFFNEDGTELLVRAAHGLDPDTVARARVKTGSSIAGWVAQTAENLLVNDIENDRRFRKLNHPQYETKSLLCVPLRISGEIVGVVNVSNKATGVEFDADDLNLLVAISRRVGTALERVRSADRAGDVQVTLNTIRTVIRAKRSLALWSSRRAFKLATDLGRRLGLPVEELEVLGYVARVHDVGMITAGEDLIASARRWTEQERQRVETHPRDGVRLLQPIEFGSRVNETILCHHEHFDGHGYPRGLAGEEIPLASRILAVVDAFEAMTLGRPYRDSIPQAEAMAELDRCAGTQFDPRVVAELQALLSEQRAGSAPEAAASGRAASGPAASGSADRHHDSIR